MKKLKKCSVAKKNKKCLQSKHKKNPGQKIKTEKKREDGQIITHVKKNARSWKKARSLKIVNNKSAEKMAKQKKHAKQAKKWKRQNGSECTKKGRQKM